MKERKMLLSHLLKRVSHVDVDVFRLKRTKRQPRQHRRPRLSWSDRSDWSARFTWAVWLPGRTWCARVHRTSRTLRTTGTVRTPGTAGSTGINWWPWSAWTARFVSFSFALCTCLANDQIMRFSKRIEFSKFNVLFFKSVCI